MSDRGILLTGATGFLGGDLIPRLLAAHPEASIYCLIRADDADAVRRRLDVVTDWCELEPADRARVLGVQGVLDLPDLGLGAGYDELAGQIDEVYHVAASTKFDLPLEQARAVNRDGADHALAFAKRAQERGGLRRLHHVSTAYVAGDLSGLLTEKDVPAAPDHRNTYEQTKWEAEQLLERARAELPITCYRPSIVTGDARTGRTLHFRVLYDPVKWVYYGNTNLLPCRPEVHIDVVPVDYVCDALVHLAQQPESVGETYHLTAGPEGACTIQETVDLAIDAANRYHAEIGKPPVEPPTIISPESADTGTPEERERARKVFALGRTVMRTHLPYMLTEQLFDPSKTRSALAGSEISCPPLRDYYETILRWAVARDFGTR